MNVRLLRSALEDLEEGRDFYDRQDPGVGDYFIDSLFAEIGSLRLMAAFIGSFSDFTG